MTREELNDLWERYSTGNCTPEEMVFMNAAYLKYIRMNKTLLNEDELLDAQDKLENNLFEPDVKQTKKINWSLRSAYAVAAVVILLGIWTLLFVKMPLPAKYSNDIDPGGNNATLTLSNGQKINLNTIKNSVLSNYAGIEIIKTTDGKVIYKATGSPSNSESILTNTIQTPKGGQYQIELSDGSKVWLNAASSLEFPAAFAGSKQRIVVLTGEAYFEVAKDEVHPFIVKSMGQEVEVLGTHFNISSYAGESTIKTTLLEGLVIVKGMNNVTLKPNQQALNTGNTIKVQPIDADDVIAWKNGKFAFRQEPLESIMLKLSRWYNVNVVFENQSKKELVFGGTISKFSKISEVLYDLERTGDVKFKIEGRRIIVLK